jgi:hypothetical protein
VNPQVNDVAVVVATEGDTGGTAPPCWEDVQPAISMASTVMHIAKMTKEVFIRPSPLLIQQIRVIIFMGQSGSNEIFLVNDDFFFD